MKFKIFTRAWKKLTLFGVAAVTLALSNSSAFAQSNSGYDRSTDIVLFAQKFGGSQILLLNIGTYVTIRDTTINLLNLKNINAELTTISGSSSWFNDPDLWWGLVAAPNNSSALTGVSNGDPRSTLYVSKGRTALGISGTAQSSAPSFANTDDPVAVAATAINVNNRLEIGAGALANTDRLLEAISSSLVDEANPFLNATTPGTAYGFFGGGVMGNLGSGTAGTVGPLTNVAGGIDLYRIVRANGLAGEVDGPLLSGGYEGSFFITQSGSVSFIAPVPEPATIGLLGIGALLGLTIRRRPRQS